MGDRFRMEETGCKTNSYFLGKSTPLSRLVVPAAEILLQTHFIMMEKYRLPISRSFSFAVPDRRLRHVRMTARARKTYVAAAAGTQ